MNERRWERIGATYGVVFAALLVASFFAAPVPPHVDASVGKITSYFADHRQRIIAGQLLGALAAVAFLLFVGHLRHVLTRAEQGSEAVSPILMAAGIALPVVALMGSFPIAVMALAAGQHATLEPGLVRALYDGNAVAGGFIGLIGALFLASAGLAMVSHELIEPWLGWVGLLIAGLLGTVGVASFYLGSYQKTWVALGIISLLAFALWVFASSVIMLVQPEESKVARHRPILQTTG